MLRRHFQGITRRCLAISRSRTGWRGKVAGERPHWGNFHADFPLEDSCLREAIENYSCISPGTSFIGILPKITDRKPEENQTDNELKIKEEEIGN